jgi:hypothetical protein
MTVFHVIFGALATFIPWGFIAFFYLIFFNTIFKSIDQLKKGDITTYSLLLTYLLGFELLARITKVFPFIPTEFAKYFSVLLGTFMLFVSKKKMNTIGIVMLVLMLPASLYDKSDSRVFADIVNYYLPPVGLGLGIMLWGSYNASDILIKRMLRLLWLPFVATLISLIVKTPDLDTVQFELQANGKMAGGAATNQVATILGFGMFLTFYSIFKKENFSGYRLLDIGIFFLFAFQGLLTFSRGGMMVGLVCILIVALTPSADGDPAAKKKSNPALPILYMIAGIILLAGAFMVVDDITGGKLTLRYQGETKGTSEGYSEKSMSKLTSGRSSIFEEDMKIWAQNPLIGGGAGSSGHLREQMDFGMYAAPHIEFTRLVAEHGILGLIYFFLMIYIGWKTWQARKRLQTGDLLFTLYILALLTSFHAAMRTFVTPFLISVCAMTLAPRRIRAK